MGLTNSIEEVEFYDKSKKIIYSNFMEKDGVATITKDDFRSKFSEPMFDLVECLWTNYASGNDMMLHEYERIIEDLKFETCKTRYFLGLLSYDLINSDHIDRLLRWSSFGKTSEKLKNSLVSGLINSFGNDVKPFAKDRLASYLNRHFPEMTDDIAFLITYSLETDRIVAPSYPQFSGKDYIINNDHLWVIINSFPAIFKKRADTVLKNASPLNIEQVNHLNCLYSSKFNGFSLNTLRDSCFDYAGPMIMILESDEYSFLIGLDEGLKESWKLFGSENARLFQVYPQTNKIITGTSSRDEGIFYCQFSTKTTKLGFLVGLKPLISPVLEVDSGFSKMSVMGGEMKSLTGIEVWAAGAVMHLSNFYEIQKSKRDMVDKEKNRKLKLDPSDWQSNPDRILLELGGVSANNADLIGGRDQIEPEKKNN